MNFFVITNLLKQIVPVVQVLQTEAPHLISEIETIVADIQSVIGKDVKPAPTPPPPPKRAA